MERAQLSSWGAAARASILATATLLGCSDLGSNGASNSTPGIRGNVLQAIGSDTAGRRAVRVEVTQDTGVSRASPDQNFGAAERLELDTGRFVLLQFDRATLKEALGFDGFVKKAELVVTSNPGPVSARAEGSVVRSIRPRIEALALSRTWSESGATWNCADDLLPANGSFDCVPRNAWNMERSDDSDRNPWYVR